MNDNQPGIFQVVPLPWRYDSVTRNVIASNGMLVCRNGDSVHGIPEIGEAIVKVFNGLPPFAASACSEALRPRNLMFDCPKHSLQTGKPIRGNAVLRLSCGCEFVAVTGIGWLLNEVKTPNDEAHRSAPA